MSECQFCPSKSNVQQHQDRKKQFFNCCQDCARRVIPDGITPENYKQVKGVRIETFTSLNGDRKFSLLR